PHLVLEKLAERLDELQVHPLGQTADIVMRLDGNAWPSGKGDAFDDVGIERALRKEFRTTHLPRLSLKDIDKQPADGLALGLGILDTCKLGKEEIRGIAVNKRNVVVIAEEAHHLFRFAGAHQPRIDID